MIRSLYLAGHTGLLGSALWRRFTQHPGLRLVTATRAKLDLTQPEAVERFLIETRPEALVLAAGRVGGIAANASEPAQFIYENLVIEANLIHGAWKAGVKRLLNFGSSCMYPRDCPQPMRPDLLMSGVLEPTSEPYAVAKWAGMVLCSSYNRQYGTRFISAIPATLYGSCDCFDPMRAHVISSLILKFHEAKEQGEQEVTLWGTGLARREFLYVEDAAEACELLLERYEASEPINIGSGESVAIRELATSVAQTVGFQGQIRWDTSRPEGAPQKLLDSTPISRLGWTPRTDLKTGLKKTYQWFLENEMAGARS